MASGSRTPSDYLLGSSEAEQERLIAQAAILRGWTERFFQSAGLRPGMRVLDVGCGAGDVSFLAAEMVAPDGSVVGIDRDPTVLDRARERANRQASGKRIDFLDTSLSEFQDDQSFDAVVGRYVLMHQPDPCAAMRQAAAHLMPQGLLIFHEMDFAHIHPMQPEPPLLFQRMVSLVAETFWRAGLHPDMGRRMARTFLDAGLPWPSIRAEVPVGGEPGSYLYGWLEGVVRTLLPRIEQLGLATADEIQIDTLTARMEAEVAASRTQLHGPTQFGAWIVVP